ncbi:glycoside hydrolase family 88 protein [Acholeplasma granularum]|uniref:glycoside hydrolase family 88 protein n=1 Tax=Acholeplasma granularum TaxID=264635 RepID=UPI00047036C6|nr:glycoside hydrolase family 88 protein [Acholeplasma granularum]
MAVTLEVIKNKERFNQKLDSQLIKEALDYSIKSIDHRLETYGSDLFPTANSRNNKYKPIDNLFFPAEKNPDNWTTGFWSGQIWLAYQYTQDNKYKKIGQRHSEIFKERMDNYYNGHRKLSDLDHHDIGFLYLLSTKADYQLTGSLKALETTLQASELLMNRYVDKAGILQAWGDMNNPLQRGRIIIDCNMNTPLLYFASKHKNDPKYANAATNHLNQAAKTLVRSDASTYHTFFFDTETGEPKYGNTFQGYSDDSSWARGQAWGILGFALAYGYNKEQIFLERSKQTAHYFLNRLPNDLVCNWDLIFLEDNGQRDTSAAAIAAIGLLELSKYASDPIYKDAAVSITHALIKHYMGSDLEGLVKSGVYHYHGNLGINEYLVYGDYFFMELLLMLHQDIKSFWK